MSLIGKRPIRVPNNVNIKIDERRVSIEGPRGRLEWVLPEGIDAVLENGLLTIRASKEGKIFSSLHGLTRAYINNMVKGVTEGYTKALEIIGVGYRAQVEGRQLVLQLGFTHPIRYPIREGITIKTPKPNQIFIEGIDKVLVGEVAAEIRSFFKPEPYKGKGIRYIGEFVRKKAGKAVAGAAGQAAK